QARALVVQQAARGSALLRDLAHTAWVRSAEAPAADPDGNPIVPAHPRYNSETGSAPAHVPGAPAVAPRRGEGEWLPLTYADPVMGKAFYRFEATARAPQVRAAVAEAPPLATLARAHVAGLARAVEHCGAELACHAAAMRWTEADIATAATALEALAA